MEVSTAIGNRNVWTIWAGCRNREVQRMVYSHCARQSLRLERCLWNPLGDVIAKDLETTLLKGSRMEQFIHPKERTT